MRNTSFWPNCRLFGEVLLKTSHKRNTDVKKQMRRVGARPADHVHTPHVAVEFAGVLREVVDPQGLLIPLDKSFRPVTPARPRRRTDEGSILISPGAQRFFFRHTSQAKLNIVGSEARDLLLLADGMRIEFTHLTDATLPAVVVQVRASGSRKHARGAAWYNSMADALKGPVMERSLNDLLARPFVEEKEDGQHSSDQASDEMITTSDLSKSVTKGSSSANKVTKSVVFVSSDEPNDDGDDAIDVGADGSNERLGADDGEADAVAPLLPWDSADEGFTLHDDSGALLVTASPQQRTILVGASARCQIRLPWANVGDIVAAFTCVADSSLGFLSTPRLEKTAVGCRITLVLPRDVAFPLKQDDCILVGMSNAPLVFRMVSPMRQVTNAEQCNANQLFESLSLQVTSRKSVFGSKAEELTNEFYVVPTRTGFTIGSADEADIVVKSSNLGRKHFAFTRNEKLYEVQTKSKRNTSTLVGRGDSFYRPPVLLRTKDVIHIGRTQLKVVYQSRRDSFVDPEGVANEVLMASGADRSKSKTRLLEDLGVFSRSQTDADGHISFEVLLERLGVEQSTGPLLIVLVMRGKLSKRFYLIDERGATIGSSPSADVCFSGDVKLSGLHCRLYFDVVRHRWALQDLESESGTFLRFQRGHITAGDVFVAGSTIVRVSGLPVRREKSGGFLRRFFMGKSSD